MIVNAISAIRRAEDLGMPVARELWIWPIPHGPNGNGSARAVHERLLGLEVREEQDVAEQFLADLCVNYRRGDARGSKLFNFPSFPAHIR